jgi:hypothetical protein
MNLVRRRFVAGTLAAGSLAAGSLIARRPAGAVIVQDDTWRAEGGGPGREAMGFRAHVALANQPQFRALMASSEYRGEQWGYVSSTWIGNVQGRGRLLTAAHAFACRWRPPIAKANGHRSSTCPRGSVHARRKIPTLPPSSVATATPTHCSGGPAGAIAAARHHRASC